MKTVVKTLQIALIASMAGFVGGAGAWAAGGIAHYNTDYRMSTAAMLQLRGIDPHVGLPTSPVDYSPKMPLVGDEANENADCVAFSMAYYKSFQEAVEHDDWWNTSTTRVSPSDLYDKDGRKFFFCAGEALTQEGGVTEHWVGGGLGTGLSQEPYRILGYGAFFINKIAFDSQGRFSRTFANNTDALANWLASGDCFVIGVPATDPWNSYYGVVAGTPYTGNPSVETVSEFRALLVVGYDPASGLFKVLNSQGAAWGNNGYGWLTTDFMRKYVIEAWWMTDEIGFLAREDKIIPTAKGATRQIAENADYLITYTGLGSLSVTTQGIIISNGGGDDTLTIKQKGVKGQKFVEHIPFVQSNGGFKRFYTNVQTWQVVTTGSIKSLTASGCYVNGIVSLAGQVGKVSITGAYDSTYPILAEGGLGKGLGQGLGPASPYRGQSVSIWATTPTAPLPPTASLKLNGVMLDSAYLPGAKLAINLATKKYSRKWIPLCASQAGIINAAIESGQIDKIAVTGGSIEDTAIYAGPAGAIKQITVKSQTISTTLSYPDNEKVVFSSEFGGDISNSSLRAAAEIGNVSALRIGSSSGPDDYTQGLAALSLASIGSISASKGDCVVSAFSAGPINSITARSYTWRDPWGSYANGGKVNARLMAGAQGLVSRGQSFLQSPLGAAPLGNADIGTIYGQVSVDAQILAGAAAVAGHPGVYRSNSLGSVKTISADKPYVGEPPSYGHDGDPSISGQGWGQDFGVRWWQSDFEQRIGSNAVMDTDTGLIYVYEGNDNFANAIALDPAQASQSNSQYIYTQNLDATRETTETLLVKPNGQSVGNSLWYSFTPEVDGRLHINHDSNSPTSIVIVVYTGSGLSNLTKRAGGGASNVNLKTTAGTPYWIAIEGTYDAGTNTAASGPISFRWYPT